MCMCVCVCVCLHHLTWFHLENLYGFFFHTHIYRWSCSSTVYISICTLPSFLCKSFLQPDRCIVCFLFIIKKSNNLAVYLHLVRVWPNMYLNVDFKYRQVLSLLELLAMGISFTPTKATSDLKKKKKDDNFDFDAKIFCDERVYLITKHHWALGSPEFYAVKYGCAKLVKTDIENEKDELNFKIKEKHVAYVWWYIFLVFAYWSGLLNGAQKSGKGKTLGTRQVIHNKWWHFKSASPSPVPLPPPPGRWKEDVDASIYRQLWIKEPLLDPHMWRRLGPIFSFQGTELLTHRVTISCSTAVSEDLHSHKREELKNKKDQDSFENCLSSHGQANSLKSLVKGGKKKRCGHLFFNDQFAILCICALKS